MTSLRVGLSGCGRRGDEIVRAIRTHEYCDVIALHDPDQLAAARLGERHGIAARTTSFDEFLGTGVDFVVLASPCGDRLEQVRAAAEQSVHCLLHPPMAPDAETAAAMVAACDAAEVKLGVAVREQGCPMVEQIRQMLADDWLGAPVAVTSLYGEDDALRRPPPEDHWSRDPARAGGHVLLQLVSDHVHLAMWLTGRAPLAVSSTATTGFSVMPQDSAASQVQLRGGVLCSFTASHLMSGNAFAIHGTDGAVRLAPDRVFLRGRKAWRGEVFEYQKRGEEMPIPRNQPDAMPAVRIQSFELHGRFARWIDDRDDFPCPGDQAAIDMKVLDASLRAQQSQALEHI